jgi:hypothetical protein
LTFFEGNRMGVVVFAGDAYPLVPLTGDLNAVSAFLDVVRPQMVALPGSNIERAVSAALDLLPAEGEGRVVVLITDGENLQGDTSAAARALREADVGVLAVTAGTSRGGPIPVVEAQGGVQYKRDSNGRPVVTRARPEVLEELAEAVDGDVLDLEGGRVVDELADRVERLRTRELEETMGVRRQERFQLFLVAAAGLLVLGFGLSPWRRMAAASLVVTAVLAGIATAQTPQAAGSAAEDGVSESRQSEPPPITVSWWQRLIPGGSRRLARSGAGHWADQELEDAARDFAGAAMLDADNPNRLFDLGTSLAAGGLLEESSPVLRAAHEAGSVAAAYNGGTAALAQGQAQQAVEWLRQALLRNPDDREAKINYELALRMLEQQQEEQQENQQEQNQDQEQEGQPTPTPSPEQNGAQPTPTPQPSNALLAALDRAEAEAREQLRSPTPQEVAVEKDW